MRLAFAASRFRRRASADFRFLKSVFTVHVWASGFVYRLRHLGTRGSRPALAARLARVLAFGFFFALGHRSITFGSLLNRLTGSPALGS